jgi:hypothetical protein
MDYSRHRSSLPFYLPREKKERKKERIPRPEKPPLHYNNRLGLQVCARERERERERERGDLESEQERGSTWMDDLST